MLAIRVVFRLFTPDVVHRMAAGGATSPLPKKWSPMNALAKWIVVLCPIVACGSNAPSPPSDGGTPEVKSEATAASCAWAGTWSTTAEQLSGDCAAVPAFPTTITVSPDGSLPDGGCREQIAPPSGRRSQPPVDRSASSVPGGSRPSFSHPLRTSSRAARGLPQLTSPTAVRAATRSALYANNSMGCPGGRRVQLWATAERFRESPPSPCSAGTRHIARGCTKRISGVNALALGSACYEAALGRRPSDGTRSAAVVSRHCDSGNHPELAL